jgi:hypothetical protein
MTDKKAQSLFGAILTGVAVLLIAIALDRIYPPLALMWGALCMGVLGVSLIAKPEEK